MLDPRPPLGPPAPAKPHASPLYARFIEHLRSWLHVCPRARPRQGLNHSSGSMEDSLSPFGPCGGLGVLAGIPVRGTAGQPRFCVLVQWVWYTSNAIRVEGTLTPLNLDTQREGVGAPTVPNRPDQTGSRVLLPPHTPPPSSSPRTRTPSGGPAPRVRAVRHGQRPEQRRQPSAGGGALGAQGDEAAHPRPPGQHAGWGPAPSPGDPPSSRAVLRGAVRGGGGAGGGGGGPPGPRVAHRRAELPRGRHAGEGASAPLPDPPGFRTSLFPWPDNIYHTHPPVPQGWSAPDPSPLPTLAPPRAPPPPCSWCARCCGGRCRGTTRPGCGTGWWRCGGPRTGSGTTASTSSRRTSSRRPSSGSPGSGSPASPALTTARAPSLPVESSHEDSLSSGDQKHFFNYPFPCPGKTSQSLSPPNINAPFEVFANESGRKATKQASSKQAAQAHLCRPLPTGARLCTHLFS